MISSYVNDQIFKLGSIYNNLQSQVLSAYELPHCLYCCDLFFILMDSTRAEDSFACISQGGRWVGR